MNRLTKPLLLLLALLCAGCGIGKTWDYDHGIYNTSTSFTDKWNRNWTCEPCPGAQIKYAYTIQGQQFENCWVV